mmetsp:Transcript_16542/g.24815  ORF Transcript_16542/g.24815 Transcript_16542/m.24815 type:complete len:110 (-) Transcript_16542:96-425(-)
MINGTSMINVNELISMILNFTLQQFAIPRCNPFLPFYSFIADVLLVTFVIFSPPNVKSGKSHGCDTPFRQLKHRSFSETPKSAQETCIPQPSQVALSQLGHETRLRILY